MLVISLAKWNNQKVFGFYPLHNHFKYVLHVSLFDSLYSGKIITVDVNKMGVGENAWKKVHLNTLLTEGDIHVLVWFFFPLEQRNT